jgi:hypothetical protein
MAQNRSRCKRGLEGLECRAGRNVESEYCALPEKAGEREDNAGVALDEATVEVGETEEGLEVSDRPWLWP